MEITTRLIHSGADRDPYTGASGVPLYLSSTFDQREALLGKKYDYTRSGNPTRDALENAVADLEEGHTGLAFASGMAAVSSLMLLFRPGDHLVVSKDVYGGTFRVLRGLFSHWGLEASFVDTTDVNAVRASLTPKTRGIYVETPSNPLLKITDLTAIAALAKEHHCISIVDNTFCSPYLQRPLTLGFDIVVHSATKFLNGHSDVLAGIAVTREEKLGTQLRFIQNAFGAVPGVQDAWLLLRGIKTLGVRMEAGQAGAALLASKLSALPQVKKVHYPGLPDHPGKEIHDKQASGPGAVLSFELESPECATAFLNSVKLPLVGVSLGGVESILSHPATMSHASMPQDERLHRGITDSLIRLSVGLESPEDLRRDFMQALGQG